MRVYVKKENKNTMIPGIIVTIVFLLVSSWVFITVIKSEKSFIEILENFGIELIFSIIFFGIGTCFVYFLFKTPKKYKVKLVNKKIETYNGEQITYMEFMEFELPKAQKGNSNCYSYSCYTKGENDLIVGNDYVLRIKQFNWEPKFVEKLDSCFKNKIAFNLPNRTLTPIFLIFGLIFFGLLCLCILGIITYPKYMHIYVLVGIFSLVALFMAFKGNKRWKEDNDIDQNKQDININVKKIKPIDIIQEKVGDVVIKYLIILLVAFPIVWFIILLNMNIEKELFSIAFLPILLFVELPIIIAILYNVGYDARLIKRNKVKILENINISNIKFFNIFRPTKNAVFSQYFIVDQNRNLIFKIKACNFIGNKFVICDRHNIKIGEIHVKLFSLTNEFIINIINEAPFIVRLKIQLHYNYQIIGRAYYVKGDTHLIRNIIYDNKENEIAYISAISKRNNNWYALGNTEIFLNDGVNNSIDIIIIALCVTMGNFRMFKKYKSR